MNFYHGTTLRNAIRIAEIGFLPRKGRSGSLRISSMPRVVLNKKRAERVAHHLSLPVKLMFMNCIAALEKSSLCAAAELLPSGGVSHPR